MPRAAQHYSAKLLFQFRVVTGRKSNLRRTCEERIITFQAPGPERAWQIANRMGQADSFTYQNDSGGTVHFEYVGIMELIEFGPERSGPAEVWYDIVERSVSRLLVRRLQRDQLQSGLGRALLQEVRRALRLIAEHPSAARIERAVASAPSFGFESASIVFLDGPC